MCWYSFLIDFVIGCGAGLVATLWILYIQFKRSASNTYLEKVELATCELHNQIDKTESKIETDTSTSIIRSQYRPYLSVFIDLLLTSFGGGSLSKKYDKNDLPIYPCLIHYKSSENGFEDGWLKFQIEVKHLMDPANAYIFLTRIPPTRYFKQLRKIKILADLLNQIENVVGFHDGLLHDSISSDIEIIDPKTATKFVFTNKLVDKKKLLEDFEKELKTLENNWLRWIKILKL